MSAKILTRCLFGFLLSCIGVSLRAQTLVDRADGSITLLAGWDFNGISAFATNSQNARYNQQYSPYFTAGTSGAGNVNYLSNLSFTSNGGTFGSARNVASSNAPLYDIVSDGLLVSNNSLGDQGSTTGRSILLSNTTTLDSARAVFSIQTLTDFDRFEDINVAYSARNQGAVDAFIAWSYSIDGGFTFVPIIGTTATIAPSGGSYSVFTADFSALGAIEGRTNLLLGLEYTESAAAASVFLDNVAIYGTAAPLAVPPSITGLSDVVALDGANVTFTPTIGGAGTSPTYRWETSPYNEQTWLAVPGATGPTLTLTAVTGAGFAQYRLVVGNPTNNTSTTSPAFRLLRATVPAIAPADQPQGQTINPGQSAIFAVIASGTDPLSYQWFKGDAPLTDNERISGASSAILTITGAEIADSGDYTVRVSNDFGDVLSSVATLVVDLGEIAPSIIVQPAPVTANSGATIDFVVVASGTPEPSYRWRRGNELLSDSMPGVSGSTTPTLTLSAVNESFAGDYSVIVENDAGSITSNPAALDVLFAPRITAGGQPQSVAVNTGQTAIFSVIAEGNPQPTYQWRRGTQALPGETAATLTLANVTLDSAGSYSVVVTNSRGNVTSAAAVLTVRSAPVITQEPQSSLGYVGGSATLRVTATGVPAVSYQWFRGDAPVLGATSATLSLSPLSTTQAGDYTVRVTNSGGSVTSAVASVAVGFDVIRAPGGGTQTYLPGASLRFQTGVTGTNLRYQWYRNGRAIPEATGVTYSIDAASFLDAGVYSFRAFAPNGRVLIDHTVGRVAISRAGSFRFLLREMVTDEPLGQAIITVANNLQITGSLLYEDGAIYPLRGVLTEDGRAATGTLTLDRGDAPSLTLALDYDYAAIDMSGRLTVAGLVDFEAAGRASAPARAPAWKGKYTLVLAPVSEGEPTVPASLPVTIATSGTAKITGRLSDGTRYTASTPGDLEGNFPFYTRPYGRSPGVLSGDLTVVFGGGVYGATAASSGNWFWQRPAAEARPEIDLILAPTLTRR